MPTQIDFDQINQSNATRGQGLFWNGFGWIVSFVKMSFATVTVASSTASTIEKMFANYVCDGTADDVKINQALQDVKVKGGTVQLSTGDFNLAAPLYIEGDNDPTTAKNVGIIGVGSKSTRLVTALNIDAIVLRFMPKPTVKNLDFLVSGSGCAIRSIANTTGSNDRRGFWQGEFRNLSCSATSHTGWFMYLEQPFRSDFNMIQSGSGLANGIKVISTFSGFNPGNNSFKNCTMGLDVPNGIAYSIYTADTGGQQNLNTFELCDAIDTSSTSTTSFGWEFRGSATTYYSSKNNLVISSNTEGFNTAVKFTNSSDNDVNMSSVSCKNNGSIFNFSANSQRNICTARSGFFNGTETQNLVIDANTEQHSPNTVGRCNYFVPLGATLACSPSTATIIEQCNSTGPGTIDPKLARWTLPANQIQKINVSAVAPLDGQTFKYNQATNLIEWSTITGGGTTNYVQMTGTTFGSTEFATGTNTYLNAWDNNNATFFDAVDPGSTGIDLGAGNAKILTKLAFVSRASWAARMNGGQFQGSNDGTNYTTFYTIPATPADNVLVEVVVSSTVAYQYYRYLSPANGFCNVAEIKLYYSEVLSGGGLNQQVVQVDFGAKEDGMVVTTIPAPWVTATTKIIVQPSGTATSDHDPDDYGVEGISAYVSNIVAGIGFDLITHAKNSSNTTWGKYNFNIIYQ
jgi:hypothetical protein